MRCERRTLGGDPAAVAAELRDLIPGPASVRDAVAEIIDTVRAGGDAALQDYTRRFDTDGAEPAPLIVSPEELGRAVAGLQPDVRAGLERAIENVGKVAKAALRSEVVVEFPGHEVKIREAPVSAAAVYVPGGRAPYPSTVVMGAVTAQEAGVGEVAVCSPPGRDGDVHPVVLAACGLLGVGAVYRAGGAQAVAALAYGTESVTAVDVIVGPGNLYVQEAKRQVSDRVGIDGFAGPSDLVVIAAPDADPEPVALDLLAQAEHGPGTLVVLVSSSPELLDHVQERLISGQETGAVAAVVESPDLHGALGLSEAIAPEHLELIGAEAEALAPEVRRAGCLFVGGGAATAFGDYIAGSNHILPTNGAARFASGLSPAQFRRTFAEVRIGDGAAGLARAAAPVARAEGFELHARSMEARIRENGGDDPNR
jgi:histidinol dehydrogenase